MLSLRHWAVVGDVLNTSKPAFRIVQRLRDNGKTVTLVNPRSPQSNGQIVHKSLGEANVPLDAVNLVISPKTGLETVREVAKLGIKNVFIQPGAGIHFFTTIL
jgi:predicted CoA-binding protein